MDEIESAYVFIITPSTSDLMNNGLFHFGLWGMSFCEHAIFYWVQATHT